MEILSCGFLKHFFLNPAISLDKLIGFSHILFEYPNIPTQAELGIEFRLLNFVVTGLVRGVIRGGGLSPTTCAC